VASQTIELNESEVELSRDEIAREKGNVPGCLAAASSTFQCDYLPNDNVTRCRTEGNEFVDSMTFRVEWEDDDCGLFRGQAIVEQRSASTPPLLATVTKLSHGKFRVEAAEKSGFKLRLDGANFVIGVDSGECVVNLSDPKRVGSTTSICVSTAD